MTRRRICACASSTPTTTSFPTMSFSLSSLLPRSRTGSPEWTGLSSIQCCLSSLRTATILGIWRSWAACGVPQVSGIAIACSTAHFDVGSMRMLWHWPSQVYVPSSSDYAVVQHCISGRAFAVALCQTLLCCKCVCKQHLILNSIPSTDERRVSPC